ncbi:hypothetical protein B5M44_20760 [Shinella sumterensis]|uniref:hypothetical protein n=1 Tax=Shinella sumterensis TaxID=1967501 RepID=UPI00106E5ABE|nr:hypothetical protein [Shinella sumterensis]MCD1265517.1 hypothetical protein [Shinella sumterensis]TFE95801.1 hypothetical protein B5M44_20760 [Shinella sumterensis]
MTESAAQTYVPWKDRAFVSIREVAQIMARSPDWVRNRIGEGRLVGRQLQAGGPVVVTVASLVKFIDGVEAIAPHVRVKTSAIYLAFSNEP